MGARDRRFNSVPGPFLSTAARRGAAGARSDRRPLSRGPAIRPGALLLVTVLLVGGCDGGGDMDVALGGLEALTVSPTRAAVGVGGTERFVATGHYTDGSTQDVSEAVDWAVTLGAGVATIDDTGLATGLSLGTATITATVKDLVASAFLEVERYGREGSWDEPLLLPLETPHEGTVNTGLSHYVFEVEPGRPHYVFVTGPTDDLVVTAYADAAYEVELCEARTMTGQLECVTDPPPDGDRLHVVVDGAWTNTFFGGEGGAEFLLEVVPGWLDEGSYEAPVVLTVGEPHDGGVGRWRSWYEVPVVYGAEYTVRVGGATGPVALDLGVFGGCTTEEPVAGEQSCVRRMSGDLLNPVVYVGEARAGAGYTLLVEQTDPPLQAEGSTDAPVDLTGRVPWDGQVDAGRSRYVFASEPGRSYRVRLEDAPVETRLAVHDGDPTFSNAVCNVSNGTLADRPAVCELVPALSNQLFIEVWTSSYELGTRFRLIVEELGWAAEGAGAPLLLDPPPVVHSGQVDGTVSRYEVPVVAGALYEVSVLDPANDVDLAVYGDAAFSTVLCTSANAGRVDEACLTEPRPAGDRLFVAVDGGGGFGGSYTLRVDRLYESEGTEAAPVTVAVDEVRASQVGPDAPSWYRVPASAGAAYRIALSGVTDEAFVQVYDDQDRTRARCSAWADGTCEVRPATGGALWLRVNAAYTDHGSGFDLSVSELPYAAEGSGSAPMDLGAAPATHDGETDATASHYRVAVESGLPWSVELTGRAVVADLRVYGDAALTQLLCASETAGVADEACVAEASGPALFVVTDGSASGFGSVYALVVERHYVSEGAVAARPRDPGPVEVSLGVPYAGQVSDEAPSYYQVAVTSGATVTVTLSGLSDEAYLYVYDDDTFTGSIVRDDSAGAVDKQAVLPQASGSIVYFKVVAGSRASGSAYTVMVQ